MLSNEPASLSPGNLSLSNEKKKRKKGEKARETRSFEQAAGVIEDLNDRDTRIRRKISPRRRSSWRVVSPTSSNNAF